jgi:hypothetical protein
MYSGRFGYGAHLPTSLGESPVFNLAGWEERYEEGFGEVTESGYGPYLGNIFDDLSKVAQKVGVVSDKLSEVASGKTSIATIPRNQATITFPAGAVSTSIPLWPLLIGAGALLYFGLRKKR